MNLNNGELLSLMLKSSHKSFKIDLKLSQTLSDYLFLCVCVWGGVIFTLKPDTLNLSMVTMSNEFRLVKGITKVYANCTG